jgi:colanic acid/amylovoran biosynthesis glycosyltransferase
VTKHFVPETPPLRVAYVLKKFPRLSETFILNEMLELERRGVIVEVFSLFRPPEEKRHALLGKLKARVTYLPSASSVGELTVKEMDVSTGALERRSMQDATAGEGFGDLMPSRSSDDIAKLMLKANTLAILAQARNIQHLHAHFGSDAATVALLAGRIAKLPFSYTAHAKDIYHTYVDDQSDNRMRRAKMHEAAFVATVSEFNRAHLQEISCDGHADIRRLYNGIDLSKFSFVDSGRDKHSILSVGRLVEKKGFADLVDACALLKQRVTDFHCNIIGDGPLEGELRQRILDRGLSGHVHLLGSLPQEAVIEKMKVATVFVLPCIITTSGDRDGLPTVLLEALASGLPAISTNVAGVPEILDHGICGLIVPPSDPESLALAIEHVLGSEEQQRNYAVLGRRKAERDFDLCKNVAVLHRYFQTTARAFVAEMGELNETLLRVG